MNARLIRTVTSQFEQMQGLRIAVAGVMLALFSWVESLPRIDAIDREVQGLAMCIPLTFSAWAGPAMRRYYARRFGRVVKDGPAWGPELAFLTWILGAFMLSLVWPRPVLVLWVLWAAYPIHVIWTGWPYRLQHLLTAAAGAYVAWARVTHAPPLPEAEMFRQTWLLAAALIGAGFLDHIVLIRALPRSAPAAVADEA